MPLPAEQDAFGHDFIEIRAHRIYRLYEAIYLCLM